MPARKLRHQKLRELLDRYRIHFRGPVSSGIYPPDHTNVFADIDSLTKKTFARYSMPGDVQSSQGEQEWKERTRRHAGKIAEKTARLYNESRNEYGWRVVLEERIFARLTTEVACPICRGRFWRSEIEASSGETTASLENRRKSRKPCDCAGASRPRDPLDFGDNPLFSDRADTIILHDSNLQAELKKKERPDRVFGLQETRNFANALNSGFRGAHLSVQADNRVRDAIRCTPFAQDGNPLLFPFLIIEAKPEESGDGFRSIELQTSLSIYTLLRIQQELQNENGEDSKWSDGPMVWFFANKGQNWQVWLCYSKTVEGILGNFENQIKEYEFVPVWEGDIRSHDKALQLLLIVDYVFDWARDIYRPAVLCDLNLLSHRVGKKDTASTTTDSDIISMRASLPRWSTQPLPCQDLVAPEAFALDSPNGVVRDASLIMTRLSGLYITRDNIAIILALLPGVGQAQAFVNSMIEALSQDSLLLTRETLNALEHKWTGKTTYNRSHHELDHEYIVQINITTYLDTWWRQVRELSFLAVSEDAINVLAENPESLPTLAQARKNAHPMSQETLEKVSDKLQNLSIEEGLLEAMNMSSSSISPRLPKSPSALKRDYEIFEVDDPFAHKAFYSISSLDKLAGQQLSELSIRRSDRIDKQSFHRGNLFKDSRPLVSRNGFLLVKGACTFSEHVCWAPTPEICLFSLRELLEYPSKELLAGIIQDEIRQGQSYHTKRLSSPHIGWHSTEWNKKNGGYSVCGDWCQERMSRWASELPPLTPRNTSPPTLIKKSSSPDVDLNMETPKAPSRFFKPSSPLDFKSSQSADAMDVDDRDEYSTSVPGTSYGAFLEHARNYSPGGKRSPILIE